MSATMDTLEVDANGGALCRHTRAGLLQNRLREIQIQYMEDLRAKFRNGERPDGCANYGGGGWQNTKETKSITK